jgi:hypothetical protein
MEERVGPTAVFGERMKIRHEAKKAFAHADSSNRTVEAMLRQAAPLVGDYRVGDLISFQREQESHGIARKRWSSASRIIGFEGRKVCWVTCEGVPYCIATDRMRPANESEALAYQYLRDHEAPMPRGQQQSFVDHSVQPDEDHEEAPDPVGSSDEELIPAGQQEEDLEDEDEIIPIPRIVRGDVEQRRVEKRPYSFRGDFPLEASRTCSQAESSTVASTICCTNAVGNRVASQSTKKTAF